MDGGGYGAAQNAGEVLLQLLRNPPTSKSTTSPPQQQGVSEDPAVAAVGPAIHTIPLQHAAFASNSGGLPYPQWNHGSTSTPPFVPDRYFKQNPDLSPNLKPDISLRRDEFSQSSRQVNDQVHLGGASRSFRSAGDSSRSGVSREVEQNLVFGSFNRNVFERDTGDVRIPNFRGNNTGNASVGGSSGMGDRRFNRHPRNSVEVNGRRENCDFFRGDDQGTVLTTVNHRKQSFNGTHRGVVQPPGYSNIPRNVSNKDCDFGRRNSGQLVDGHKSYLHTSNRSSNHRAEPPSPPDRNRVEYVGTIFVVESPENDEELNADSQDKAKGELGLQDGLDDQFAKILEVGDESVDKPENKKHHRDKDYRSDQRGHWIMNQRMRHMKSQMRCRSDIYRFDAPLLEIFESLNPAEEEKMKQMHLLRTLEDLVVKEWPEARLHVYGSCANSFGFPKSDIDVCLVMELENTDKTEVLLKLAEILEVANLQDVQAFTRARVPIVKLKDPETGIACDICVNNVLAVVNTRLLRDYAKIDSRVRQLAFIVKHWAKSRLVNDTYHGTLSSYAYVLMCIHLLQQRRPPILPCLQEMESTYSASIENVECSYFDQVDKLQNVGSENRETIARLVWAFFHYWAYCHDYASDVISIRTGTTLSKQDKDWTRRIGNDRHLICIEDPFELSHDLGRVVDKHSVRVLREEFERAARIMQHDPNPCLTLFEPYVPN